MRRHILMCWTATSFTLGVALLGGAAIAQTSPKPAPAGSPATGTSDTNKPGGIQSAQTAAVKLRFITVQPADTLSSRLVGANVYNNQNESIGEIADLVIENGKTVKAVVLGIGGFLGMGERYVTVDPTTLVLHRGNDNSMRVMADASKEELKNAPTFDYSKNR